MGIKHIKIILECLFQEGDVSLVYIIALKH